MRLKFLPRSVVALDGERRAYGFRLGVRLDGALRVARLAGDAPARPTRRFVLALDPALGFFRNAQIVPRGASELAALAGDMFPFDVESVVYCASVTETGAVRYHALLRADLDALLEEWPDPAAVIAAQARPDAILAALSARIDRGGVGDFLPHPARLVPPAALIGTGLGGLAAAGVVTTLVAWNVLLTNEQRELRHEVAQLEAEAAPVLKQREAILRMAPSLREQAAFSRLPAGTAFEVLGRILAHAPEGSAIESIEMTADTLTVGGLGNDAAGWFASAGVHPLSVKVDTLPKLSHFQATLSIKEVAASAAAPSQEKRP